jgi:chemotaxis protein MotB
LDKLGISKCKSCKCTQILQKDGVKPENMYAAAFGEYHPKADNNTAEGRALNRRIDIQILPKPLSLEETKKLADIEEEGN